MGLTYLVAWSICGIISFLILLITGWLLTRLFGGSKG